MSSTCTETRTVIRPTLDRIVVKADGQHDQTAGGLYLPDNAREPSRTGTVLAVGPGRRLLDGKLYPPGVRVGDRVVFHAVAGTKYGERDEEVVVLDEGHIFGVLEG